MLTKICSRIKALVVPIPIKGEKMKNLGVLTIDRTVVSRDYLKNHPTWDAHLYRNIIIV